MTLRFTSTLLRIVGVIIPMSFGLYATVQQPPQKSTTTQQARPNPAAAQKQVPGNIGAAAAQTAVSPRVLQTPPIPNIHLVADRNSALVGEPVTFTIEPSGQLNSRYVFTIAVGDFNSGELSGDSPRARYAFKAPGTFPMSFSYKLRPAGAVFPPIAGPVNPDPIVIHAVTLTASPLNPTIGETVTFEMPFPSTDPETQYRFIFGDEADASPPWITEPRSTHEYDRSGPFDARLEVRRSRQGDFAPIGTAATQVEVAPAVVPPTEVKHAEPVTPVSVPELRYSPPQPGEGETVTFRINYEPDGTDLVFRVGFGDGSPPSEWSPSPEVSHVYRPAGTYVAHGEVGRVVNNSVVPVANSADISIVILAHAVWGWIVLIAVALTAFGVYQYWKNIPFPNPVFESHQNRKKSTMEMNDLTIDVEVRLIRNLSGSEFETDTNGHNLITSRRTKHG